MLDITDANPYWLNLYVFFFKQKTAYEMRISDWSSDVCSSDLHRMMLTPRSSHALRLISADLSCQPAAELEWTQDVFGNLIATASFPNPSEIGRASCRERVCQYV